MGGSMNMGSTGSVIGMGANMFAGFIPEKKVTDEDNYNLQTYGQDILKRKQTSDQVGGQVENVVGMLGPWGAAAAGVSKIAGKAFGADAYGDYKDDFGGKTKKFLNRSLNIKEGVAGLMDTFKRPTADNIKSQLSMGLWGKSEREKDGERLKKDMQIRKTNDMLTETEQLNTAARAGLSGFKAPAYGRKGLKFKSKFNRT